VRDTLYRFNCLEPAPRNRRVPVLESDRERTRQTRNHGAMPANGLDRVRATIRAIPIVLEAGEGQNMVATRMISIVGFAALFSLSVAARSRGDMVYGYVYLDSKPASKQSVVVEMTSKSTVFVTDQAGRFKIVLPPGQYKAHLNNSKSMVVLRAEKYPVRQDLKLSR